MRDLKFPYGVTWLLTDRCNLRCPHCYFETRSVDDPSGEELSTERCLEVVDELAACKIFMINFGGYEALVREDFFSIAWQAHRRGMTIQVSTNGMALDEATVRRLVDCGFQRVQVSLDGSTADINDPIRGGGVYASVIRGIKLLRSNNILVHLALSIVASNLHDTISLIRLARDLGCSIIKLQPFEPFGRGARNRDRFFVPSDQMERVLNEIIRLDREGCFFPVEINYPGYVSPLKAQGEDPNKPFAEGASHCGAGITTAVILPNGGVVPCLFRPEEDWGNLKEKSFGDIWLSSLEKREICFGKSCLCLREISNQRLESFAPDGSP